MRIAFVCSDPGVPVFGSKGCSVHAQGVLGAFARAGAQVELFAARLGGEAPAELGGVVAHEHGVPVTKEPDAREVALMATNALVVAQILDRGPFDLVYERHALFAWAGVQAARQLRVPGVLEVNAPLVAEQAAHRVLVNRFAAEVGVRRSFAAASVIAAVSEPLRGWLEQCAEARGKVHVVANGVDPRRFPRAPAAGSRPFTIAFVGTLKPWHGLSTLTSAFARVRESVPDARLLVIGDGPGREGLEAELATFGLEGAARLTGAVEPDQVGRLLADADVTVAPYPASADHYFSPLKVVEGLATGLPLVASRIGELPELVRDGQTGVLCVPGDPVDFANALVALAHDPARRARIGAAGRGWVLRERTWERVADRILAAAEVPA